MKNFGNHFPPCWSLWMEKLSFTQNLIPVAIHYLQNKVADKHFRFSSPIGIVFYIFLDKDLILRVFCNYSICGKVLHPTPPILLNLDFIKHLCGKKIIIVFLSEKNPLQVWRSLSLKRVAMVCSGPDPRSLLQGWARDTWLLQFHHCLPCSQFSKRVSWLETETSDKYPRGICRWQTPVLYWSRSQRETTIPPPPLSTSSFVRGVKQKPFRKWPYLVVSIHCLK